MLKRTEIVAITKRVASRLAANETGLAPLKEKHVRRLVTLKQQQEERRKGRKVTANRA